MLQHETVDGVTTLTLDRPDKGNALSAELVDALIERVAQTCADPQAKALVIRANGAHFCTGFDLSNLATSSEGDLLQRFVRVEQLLQLLWTAPIRTIALAQGRTWGAGADIFAACEVRLCTADTTFRFPGARFGIVLGSRRLAERVGTDAARRWILDGAEATADAALKAGFATRVVNEGERAAVLAASLAQAVDRDTGAAIRALTRKDESDRDMAELVRSASRPGLKGRIEAYVAGLRRR
jgi:enoyl-CoA hydratase/carnithine racemase